MRGLTEHRGCVTRVVFRENMSDFADEACRHPFEDMLLREAVSGVEIPPQAAPGDQASGDATKPGARNRRGDAPLRRDAARRQARSTGEPSVVVSPLAGPPG
jgi:hypothetical protein